MLLQEKGFVSWQLMKTQKMAVEAEGRAVEAEGRAATAEEALLLYKNINTAAAVADMRNMRERIQATEEELREVCSLCCFALLGLSVMEAA